VGTTERGSRASGNDKNQGRIMEHKTIKSLLSEIMKINRMCTFEFEVKPEWNKNKNDGGEQYNNN